MTGRRQNATPTCRPAVDSPVTDADANPDPESWADLFERAAASDRTEADVTDALRRRRDEP